jgi:LmbE family N-acetylglucosaminyl deacetylase
MEIITDAPRRALVVTPHPDDAEGGCGGTTAKWVKEAGTEVVVVLCTNGDKGTSDRERTPQELAAIREREQQAASDVLGVKEVVFLSHPDGGLEDTILFRGQIVREIRRHRPEVVICIDPYRSVSHTHRDHRMSGQVALDAAFSYAWSHLHFPEQITQEGLEPHQVKEAYLWGSETPDVFVDIENYLDLKVESLNKHASQFSHRDPSDRHKRVREGAARHAKTVDLPYAEGFRRIRFEIGSLAWQFLNT